MPKKKAVRKTPKRTSKATNYRRGADFERDIKKYFEDNGHIATRSAGSHGLFDIVSFDGLSVWAVQAKKGMKQKEAERLATKLAVEMQTKFRKIAYPMFLVVASSIGKSGPEGSIQVLMPEAYREAAQVEEAS